MKKTIFVTLCLCLAILLCSCMGTENGVEVINDYIPLLYENSVGGAEDHNTDRYTGEKFFSMEKYEKTNREKKNDEISGNAQALTYDWTLKSNELSYELDEYSFVKGRDAVFVSYRTDTNKIVKYQKNVANNREYMSVVNPNSSESEYIAYAKAVFLEYAGISVDAWDVRIQTWRAEYGYNDGFINYVHETPSYNAEYIITFSKKIGGIERCDKMYVHMTNVGEIIEFKAVNYDESFGPYANVQIDRTKIEEEAWHAFDNIRKNNNVLSEIINNIELITQNGSLWAQVTIEYRLGETSGGVIYVFEVARLK